MKKLMAFCLRLLDVRCLLQSNWIELARRLTVGKGGKSSLQLKRQVCLDIIRLWEMVEGNLSIGPRFGN